MTLPGDPRLPGHGALAGRPRLVGWPLAAGLQRTDLRTPPVMSGLKLHLDATQITGLADGAAVSRWSDSSGNGNDVTQATGANQPVYKATAFNGKPCVRFDGTNDVLYTASALGLDGNNKPSTVFGVIVANGTADVSWLSLEASSAAAPFYQPARGVGTGAETIRTIRRNDANALKQTAALSRLVRGQPMVLSEVYAGTSVTYAVNGARGLVNDPFDVGTLTVNRWAIGASTPNGNMALAKLQGDMGEVLVYNRALSTAECRAVEHYLASKWGATLDDHPPLELTIPTYDGNPNAGHPGVVRVPGGWNGYEYWMAFTPFPNASRENPSIVASHDGITWVEPAGITNPISPQSVAIADGYGAQSDTELILLPNNHLRCYNRAQTGANFEGLFMRESSDGVNWTDRVGIGLTVPSPGPNALLSPTVVIEADSTFTMWTCAEGTPNTLVRRTSATGTGSWSAPTVCTVPTFVASGQPWHVAAIRDGATYHMLLCVVSNAGASYRVYHLTSTDGLAWTGEANLLPAFPLSGETWDAQGQYRSTFVKNIDGTFDIWLTGVDRSAAWFSANWRIAYLPNRSLV